MAEREQPVTLRTRKFIRNPLLGRKQMVVYVSRLLLPPILSLFQSLLVTLITFPLIHTTNPPFYQRRPPPLPPQRLQR